MRKQIDGSNYWFGWTSPIDPIWLWHALFDGTFACRCKHSERLKGVTKR